MLPLNPLYDFRLAIFLIQENLLSVWMMAVSASKKNIVESSVTMDLRLLRKVNLIYR